MHKKKRKVPGKTIREKNAFCGRKIKYTEKVEMRIWMLVDCRLCQGDKDFKSDVESDGKSYKGDNWRNDLH